MILSHLSQRIVDIIVSLQHGSDQALSLRSVLRHLKAWKNRPEYLIPMAYRWCSAISKKIRECRGDEPSSEDLSSSDYDNHYGIILSFSLAVAFSHIDSKHVFLPGHLSHTPHDEWMLDIIFTRGDDDAIAHAVYVRIVDPCATPSGSCTRRLLKLTERGQPFSPRLRWTILHFLQGWWRWELEEAELEFVCLLNNLEVIVDKADDAGSKWIDLLICVLLTPMGQGHLSSHYWLLLGDLILASPKTLPAKVGQTEPMKSLEEDQDLEIFVSPRMLSAKVGQTELMKSLEEAQDWEKLETWMLVVWCSYFGFGFGSIPVQDIEQATLTLLRQRPSAIPKLENLLEDRTDWTFSPPIFTTHKDVLRRVCNEARAGQSPLGSPS
jgi:hypothetical protein